MLARLLTLADFSLQKLKVKIITKITLLVGQFAKGLRFESQRRKSGGRRWNLQIFTSLNFHPMLKYACVCCVRYVLINLRHCGKPGAGL